MQWEREHDSRSFSNLGKNYDEVKASRPISLLKAIGKISEKVWEQRMVYLTRSISPGFQFGAKEGYSTVGTVMKSVTYLKQMDQLQQP